MTPSRRELRVLVVDDEAAMREVLEVRLGRLGFEVALAESGAEARAAASEFRPDVVISDVVLPDGSGLELLPLLQSGDRRRPVILITAYGTVDAAVEAMKRGAHDFLTKPLDYEKLEALLEETRVELARRRRTSKLVEALGNDAGLGGLVGTSPRMRSVYETLTALGGNAAPAILCGESGTGKELAARTIHHLGPRARGPFVAVNAAAIPETLAEAELFGHVKGAFTGAVGTRPGYFESAHGGTLFLDEISEMPLTTQAKLLRALEDGRVRKVGARSETAVDVRVVAATNRDPERAVEEERLRRDLFYRLSVFTVEMPPLRERAEDIPLLVQHFVAQFNERHQAEVEGAAGDTLEILAGYPWPGNVRELKNALERAVIVARRGWLQPTHLPPFLRPDRAPERGIFIPAGATVAEAEKRLILATLRRHGNNRTRAARDLGLDVRTIRYKLRAYEEQE